MKWIMAHKKGLLLALAALMGLYVAVFQLVDGDQKEALVQSAKEKVEQVADQLPADAE